MYVTLYVGQATPGLLFLLDTQAAKPSDSTKATIPLITSHPMGECTLSCRTHNLYYRQSPNLPLIDNSLIMLNALLFSQFTAFSQLIVKTQFNFEGNMGLIGHDFSIAKHHSIINDNIKRRQVLAVQKGTKRN